MQGYTQKLAWDLFAYLRGIYLHICFQTWKFTFKRTLQSEPGMQGYTQKLAWDLFAYLGFVSINFMAAKCNIIC